MIFLDISDMLSMIWGWLNRFEYNGIKAWTVVLFGVFGMCLARFVFPFIFPSFNRRWSGDSSDRVRNK